MKRLFCAIFAVIFVCHTINFYGIAKNNSYDKNHYNTYEWEVLKLTNKERIAQGLQPLSMDFDIQKICDLREKEIETYFSHNMPDGVTNAYTTKIEAAGIERSMCAENIAMGQANPQKVIEAWMNSPGHKANILRFTPTHIGIGYGSDQKTWIQIFTGTCDITEISIINNNASYPIGTSIENLDACLVLECQQHGKTFMPLDESFCSGYNPLKNGKQTITVSYKKQVAAHSSIVFKYGILWNFNAPEQMGYEVLNTTFDVYIGEKSTETTLKPYETTTLLPATTTQEPVATTLPLETTTQKEQPTFDIATTVNITIQHSSEIDGDAIILPTESTTLIGNPLHYQMEMPVGLTSAGVLIYILTSVQEVSTVEIFDVKGEAVTDGTKKIGTGFIIKCTFKNGAVADYTVFVKGDLNSDGAITAFDARQILRQAAKLDSLGNIFLLAADATNDSRITASDARKILRVAAGLEKLN